VCVCVCVCVCVLFWHPLFVGLLCGLSLCATSVALLPYDPRVSIVKGTHSVLNT
jgi:hypothetical protein